MHQTRTLPCGGKQSERSLTAYLVGAFLATVLCLVAGFLWGQTQYKEGHADGRFEERQKREATAEHEYGLLKVRR